MSRSRDLDLRKCCMCPNKSESDAKNGRILYPDGAGVERYHVGDDSIKVLCCAYSWCTTFHTISYSFAMIRIFCHFLVAVVINISILRTAYLFLGRTNELTIHDRRSRCSRNCGHCLHYPAGPVRFSLLSCFASSLAASLQISWRLPSTINCRLKIHRTRNNSHVNINVSLVPSLTVWIFQDPVCNFQFYATFNL